MQYSKQDKRALARPREVFQIQGSVVEYEGFEKIKLINFLPRDY